MQRDYYKDGREEGQRLWEHDPGGITLEDAGRFADGVEDQVKECLEEGEGE